MGGANIAQQFIKAGGDGPVEPLEPIEVIHEQEVTHLRFRVATERHPDESGTVLRA